MLSGLLIVCYIRFGELHIGMITVFINLYKKLLEMKLKQDV